MKFTYYSILSFLLVSCFADNEVPIIFNDPYNLSENLVDKVFIEHEVIACAASDELAADIVNVYFYPKENSKDFKLYESFNNQPDDFTSYQLVQENSEPFFQGALRVFKVQSRSNYFIVTYELDGLIEISTPIRSKLYTQPTLWTNSLDINQEDPLMPQFSWDVNSIENNAIFFEVLSTKDFELLSGTYTQENKFQYYNLNNVVLNITPNDPPDLIKGETYVFTVMDVSVDNWVNEVITTSFVAE